MSTKLIGICLGAAQVQSETQNDGHKTIQYKGCAECHYFLHLKLLLGFMKEVSIVCRHILWPHHPEGNIFKNPSNKILTLNKAIHQIKCSKESFYIKSVFLHECI